MKLKDLFKSFVIRRSTDQCLMKLSDETTMCVMYWLTVKLCQTAMCTTIPKIILLWHKLWNCKQHAWETEAYRTVKWLLGTHSQRGKSGQLFLTCLFYYLNSYVKICMWNRKYTGLLLILHIIKLYKAN